MTEQQLMFLFDLGEMWRGVKMDFSMICPFLKICSTFCLLNNTYQCCLCCLASWGTDSWFLSLNSSKNSILLFPDFATFVSWFVFEQELTHLRNAVHFFFRAESPSENTYIKIHYLGLYVSQFFSLLLPPHKAVDGFSANSAAAFLRCNIPVVYIIWCKGRSSRTQLNS